MKTYIKGLLLICLAVLITFSGCTKEEYSFGKLITPTDLSMTTTVAGADAVNPGGDGSGNVAVSATATNAMSYKVDFGDGKWQIVPEGTVNYKYTNPGTFDYTVTVSAIGTGGITSTASKKITVFVNFKLSEEMLQNLTSGASQTWVTDRETPGHVGVGPADTYASDYYSAAPNERAACLYDDEITFTKDAADGISLSVDNKGQSFLIGASTGYYGTAGDDDCYNLNLATPRKLTFMNATSGSTPANSTRIQFVVPGNGLINFGTGGNTYEILTLTATTMTLRNIGIDGLAWYQKLKVKP